MHSNLALEGENIFIYYFFSKYLYIHQWKLFSKIIVCLLLNTSMICHDKHFVTRNFRGTCSSFKILKVLVVRERLEILDLEYLVGQWIRVHSMWWFLWLLPQMFYLWNASKFYGLTSNETAFAPVATSSHVTTLFKSVMNLWKPTNGHWIT